jgi:hypothetical protein
MNKNINLTKILKDCPKGTVLWSDVYGEVKFLGIDTSTQFPIKTRRVDGTTIYYTKEGWFSITFPASCLLWPSKDCRDWSKFTAPWYKKEKFDPKTLKPFDKVLVRDEHNGVWSCKWFSHIMDLPKFYKYTTTDSFYKYCIPYNDDTKHLVGTTEEAPEFYRYWED